MKYFLILNPGSKAGSSKKKFNKIFKILESNNIQYDYKITERLEDAYIFSKRANNEAYDAIIAVGGDGTINNVINGFYNQNGEKISQAAFGVIYTGTSPDFCKSYKIPLKLEDAIYTIVKANKKKIKIGKIELSKNINKDGIFSDDADNKVIKYFSCCVNIGLGASVASRANSGIRKYLGDFVGTFISLIISVIGYKPGNYICKYNGNQKTITKCYNLSIGITPFIASGIKVPKQNNLSNMFYLMGACNLTLLNVAGILKKIYKGLPFTNNNSLWLEYADSIEIANNIKNPNVEFDGDPAGYLPCSINFTKEELDVYVSA